MKKFLTIIALAAAVCSCGNQNDRYTVIGQLADYSGKLWLIADDQPIDSLKSKDGSFLFEGKVKVPAIAYVCNAPNRRDAGIGLMFFLEPGEIVMKVNSANDGQAYMTGTKSNDKKAEYTLKSLELAQQWAQREDDPKLEAEIDSVEYAMTMSAIKDNTDNMYGLWQLKQYSYELTDADELQSYLNEVAPELRKCKLYKSMEESVQKLRSTAVGQKYLDFKMAGLDGKEITLSKVIKDSGNKYILIDFWASWCGPCMREVPFLISSYEKYHQKGFEIFGVSLDRTAEPWRAAIQRNNMNWIHVSDLAYWNCAAAELYGVNSIPANYLIECSTGKIIAKSLRGRALERTLSELLD